MRPGGIFREILAGICLQQFSQKSSRDRQSYWSFQISCSRLTKTEKPEHLQTVSGFSGLAHPLQQ